MIQSYTPNLNVAATRGWCLKYIDDAGNAPTRRASAQLAYQAEKNAKRIRNNQSFPVGVWVVGFFSLNRGSLAGLGHVVFIKRHSNGRIEIRDTETRTGARAVYTSIQQCLNWMAIYSPKYLGWSTHCDGRQYAKAKPKPPARKAKKGTATVTTGTLNIRASYSTTSQAVGTYKKGNKFHYDSYIDANGHRWLSYIAYSGKRRYVAQRTLNGKTKFVKGGV